MIRCALFGSRIHDIKMSSVRELSTSWTVWYTVSEILCGVQFTDYLVHCSHDVMWSSVHGLSGSLQPNANVGGLSVVDYITHCNIFGSLSAVLFIYGSDSKPMCREIL